MADRALITSPIQSLMDKSLPRSGVEICIGDLVIRPASGEPHEPHEHRIGVNLKADVLPRANVEAHLQEKKAISLLNASYSTVEWVRPDFSLVVYEEVLLKKLEWLKFCEEYCIEQGDEYWEELWVE